MMGDRIKIGVVGAGYWGPNLIRNCAELGVLHSVCDINSEALQSIGSSYPSAKLFSDFEQFLASDANAVVIAAPAQLHAPMALQAIAAHKHVFVEKPLALDVATGELVCQAAEKAKVQLFVGHVLLYHAAIKKMRSLLAEQVIGEVWHLRSRRLSLGKLRDHEDVWWSFAPHDVAVMLAVMGEEPQAVGSARSSTGESRVADAAYADFRFSRGRSAHIEVCWLDPNKSARLDIFGSKGLLTLEDSRTGSSLTLTPCGKDDASSQKTWKQPPVAIDVVQHEPLHAEIAAFLDSVTSGRPAETDGREGVAVLKALAMADRAAFSKSTDLRMPVLSE